VDEGGPKDVVDEAWDVLKKAMHVDDNKTKKRALTGKEESTESMTLAGSSAPKLKRPSIRSEPPGWSMSAAAWRPRKDTARALPVVPSTSRPPLAVSSPKQDNKKLKFAIVDRVKAVLRPLYAAGDITRDEYRDIAKRGTSEAIAANVTDDATIANIVHRLRER
jgi:hypothetical protein